MVRLFLTALAVAAMLPATLAWMGLDAPTTNSDETKTVIRWRGADPTDPSTFDLHIGVADKPYFVYGYLAKNVKTDQLSITITLPALPHKDNFVLRAVEPGTSWAFAESEPFELWPE
jgi:hypothetical protein